LPAGDAFESLKSFQKNTADWLFGGFGYELKNEVEALHSRHPDGVKFPDLVFFQPETVAILRENALEIQTLHTSAAAVFDAIKAAPAPVQKAKPVMPGLQPRIPKAQYLETVDAIRQHIIEGDLYEMNFCQEFFAEDAIIDPFAVWERLNKLSRAPLAAFFRWNDRYLLSASPERFLKKKGNRLISQPIKGTRRRSPGNDEAMRQDLAASEKDRAENVMIVDLVRNDLARSCQPGSVIVEELFGIHTFETVHQMISTISGELRPNVNAIDALRHAFPPGSMTGAPKVMAMQLIEQYEKSRRGLYAGALGYFEPSGHFDFNVLIRSIFYNESSRYVSFQVGGAIVYDSVPEAEYEECMVKASALFAALSQN
jgi:para-aminobenzoate synthetase component I